MTKYLCRQDETKGPCFALHCAARRALAFSSVWGFKHVESIFWRSIGMKVNLRQFGEYRNVSPQAVARAIADGRLAGAAWKVGSRWYIDLEHGLALWDQRRQPSMRDV